MKITIYQINSDRDENHMKFMAHNKLEKFQGSSEVDSKIYDKIYEKEVRCNSLEEVYQMFNLNRPQDFKGHSLSVSDVVEVSGNEKIEDGFYFCDSIGFKKVSFNPFAYDGSMSIEDFRKMQSSSLDEPAADGIEYRFRKCSEAEKDILIDNGFFDYRYSDSDNKYIFRFPAEQEVKVNASLSSLLRHTVKK